MNRNCVRTTPASCSLSGLAQFVHTVNFSLDNTLQTLTDRSTLTLQSSQLFSPSRSQLLIEIQKKKWAIK